MATLTLATIRNLVRSNLNITATSTLSDTELNIIINDGYKDVACKSLAYEVKIAKSNIAVGERLVSLVGSNVIKVNYVEYLSGTTQGGWGLVKALPQSFGHNDIDPVNLTNYYGPPRYWFQWGEYIAIDPIPDVSTYDLSVYASCYPAAVISGDTAVPTSLPTEFHDCIALFATAFSALKLRRWRDMSIFYNIYISTISQLTSEYIKRYPEGRLAYTVPTTVTMKPMEQSNASR